MIRSHCSRQPACIQMIPCQSEQQQAYYLVGKGNEHQWKLSEKDQGNAAKIISRFTNNEECPFWPPFVWSCHWRPGAIQSGQNTSQDRRGRGKERERDKKTDREIPDCVCPLCANKPQRNRETARQEIIVRYIRHLLNSTVLGDLQNQTQGHF